MRLSGHALGTRRRLIAVLTASVAAAFVACTSETSDAPPAPGQGDASRRAFGVFGTRVPGGAANTGDEVAGENGDEDEADAGALGSGSLEPVDILFDAAVDGVLPADAGGVLPEVDPNDVLVSPDGSVSFGFDAGFPP